MLESVFLVLYAMSAVNSEHSITVLHILLHMLCLLPMLDNYRITHVITHVYYTVNAGQVILALHMLLYI
jgi:hypothetical protein